MTAGDDAYAGSLRQLRRHIVAYLVARLAPAAMQVAVIVVLTRLLSSEEYGLFALALALTFMIAEVATQWLQQAALRFIPARRESAEVRPMHDAYAVALVVSAVIGVALTIGLVALVPQTFGAAAAAVVALTLATLLFNAVRTLFPSALAPRRYAWYSALSAVARFVIPLVAVLAVDRSATSALVGTVIGYAAFVLPMGAELGLLRVPKLAAEEKAWLGRFLAYGSPMIGWFVSLQLLSAGDRFLLAVLVGTSAVGVYAAIYDLVNKTVHFVANAIELAVQPLAMRSADRDDERTVEALVRSSLRYLLLATVPVAVACLAWSRQVFGILLPAGYREGHFIAGFIAVGVLAWHATIMLQKLLEARQRTRAVFVAAGVAAAVNIGLNLVFIPALGYLGAALVTTVSYAVQVAIVAALCLRALPRVVPWASIARALTAGAAMAFVLLTVGADASGGVTVLLDGALALAAYGAILLLLREWTIGDLAGLRTALTRP